MCWVRLFQKDGEDTLTNKLPLRGALKDEGNLLGDVVMNVPGRGRARDEGPTMLGSSQVTHVASRQWGKLGRSLGQMSHELLLLVR